MPIDDKQLRHVVLRYLASQRSGPRPEFAMTRPDGSGLLDLCRQTVPDCGDDIEERLYGSFYELVNRGIIVPGSPARPFAWPEYSLTDFGRKLLERPIDTIVDTTAYVDQLRARVPGLKPAVAFYAKETVRAIGEHNVVAAAHMLGCCCELLLRDLVEAIAASLSTPEERRRMHSAVGGSADFGEVYRHMWPHLELRLAMCPAALRDQTCRELEERMSASFHFLRRIRDNTGRPSVCDFSEDEIYSGLLRLPGDAELLYGLVRFLKSGEMDAAAG